MPPTSPAFSRSARQRAASLVAPVSDSVNTEEHMRVAALERIRMQRNDDIGLGPAGDFRPSMQADEGIILAHQHPAHAGLRLNLGGQTQGDGPGSHLFPGFPCGPRAPLSLPPCPASITTTKGWLTGGFGWTALAPSRMDLAMTGSAIRPSENSRQSSVERRVIGKLFAKEREK
jgi:hypothetical protein